MPFAKGNTFGQRWSKGQTGNPTGRPKSLINEINSKLTFYDVPPVTRNEFKETIQLMMNLTQTELKDIEADAEQPIWLRWIIQDLFNDKTRPKLMIDLRNFVFGK